MPRSRAFLSGALAGAALVAVAATVPPFFLAKDPRQADIEAFAEVDRIDRDVKQLKGLEERSVALWSADPQSVGALQQWEKDAARWLGDAQKLVQTLPDLQRLEQRVAALRERARPDSETARAAARGRRSSGDCPMCRRQSARC